MALQRTRIQVPLGGIDTKTDPKLLGPGKLLEVENGTFDELGAITKRYGYEELANQPATTSGTRKTMYSTPSGLSVVDGAKVYEYASSAEDWVGKGDIEPIVVERVLLENVASRFAVQGEIARSGRRLIAGWVEYESSSGNMYASYSSIDASSYTSVRVPESIARVYRDHLRLTGDEDNVDTDYGGWAIAFSALNTLTLYRLPTTGTTSPTSVAVSTAVVGTTGGICIHARSGSVGRVVVGHSRASLVYFQVYTTLGTPTLANVTPLTRSGSHEASLCYIFASGSILLVTGGGDYAIYDENLNVAEVAWSALSVSGSDDMSIVTRNDEDVTIQITDAGTSIVILKIESDGTVTELEEILDTESANASGSYPMSVIAGDGTYLALREADQKSLFPSYHLQGTDATSGGFDVMSSRLGYGDSLGDFANAPGRAATNTATLEDGTPVWLGFVRTVLSGEGDLASYLTYPVMYALRPQSKLGAVGAGGSAIIFPGTAYLEDKNAVAELGFVDSMELTVSADSDPGGELDDTDVHLLAAVLEYVDPEGRVHRSEPTNIVTHEMTTSGGTDGEIFANVDTVSGFATTKRDGSVGLVTYRSLPGGTVLYRENTRYDLSDVRAATTIIIGSKSDDAISDNETLYTTGGVASSVAPPASRSVALVGDRVFLLASDKTAEIWFSQPLQSGLGPEFSPLLTVTINGGEGDATAVAGLDGRTIVFFERSIFYFGGSGPSRNATGSFSLPAKIPSDVGCINALSIVEVPQGLIFKSNKGFYLLTRSLGLQYIGADVEDYNSTTVVRGLADRDKNAVHFLLTGGTTTLRFDYFTQQWSINTLGITMADIGVHDGSLFIYGTDGKVYQESTTKKDDDAVDYSLKVTTPWIKVSGIEGYQRLYWIHLLGAYEGASTMSIAISYDYDDTVSETVTKAFVSSPDTFDVRVKPARQKCKAFKLTITDTTITTDGLSFSLSGIQCEIGLKQQTGRNNVAPNAS